MTGINELQKRRPFAGVAPQLCRMKQAGVLAVLWMMVAGSTALAAMPVTGLTGVWMTDAPHAPLKPVAGSAIPLTAAGKAAFAKNAAVLRERDGKKTDRNDLSACLPYGPLRLLQQPYPLQLIQRGNLFVLMYEQNHVFEIVYLDEQPDLELDPGFMGNSVGAWTRDGIVITTTGFNDSTFLDDSGLPHSDQLSMTRTLRVIGQGTRLEVVSSITDPMMYTRPWSVRQELTHRPNLRIEEYVCGQGPTLETRYTRNGTRPPGQ
ncbi:MAG: hypothetical protein AB7F79_04405 [Steroidobacteraceae bacterium]